MDVMMVLLVVFMVAAPLMTSGIALNLPKVGGKNLEGQDTSVNISVDKDGYYYIGQTEEVVRLACLDAGGKVISNQILHRGSANAAEVNIRKIVNIALRNNAMGVILAHNHPGGLPLPSEEDVATTKSIREALIPMGILLMDHIIVAGQDYVSMARSGII